MSYISPQRHCKHSHPPLSLSTTLTAVQHQKIKRTNEAHVVQANCSTAYSVLTIRIMINYCYTQTKVKWKHTLCGGPLHTVKPAPADNHAHHLTPTNTSTNKQPETPEKSNLHLYQPLPNSPTTADAEHTAKDTAHHCDPSLHHNQHFTFYATTPQLPANSQPILNKKPSALTQPTSPPPVVYPPHSI